MHHEEHVQKTENVGKEIIEAEHDYGLAEENVEIAEEVQEEKPEKE